MTQQPAAGERRAKTRQQIRNERAELVCRELRYQVGKGFQPIELGRTLELLLKWMDVTGKIKYERPTQ